MHCNTLNIRNVLSFLDEQDTYPLIELYIQHPNPEDMYAVIPPIHLTITYHTSSLLSKSVGLPVSSQRRGSGYSPHFHVPQCS